jgi:hypothetical protein
MILAEIQVYFFELSQLQKLFILPPKHEDTKSHQNKSIEFQFLYNLESW